MPTASPPPEKRRLLALLPVAAIAVAASFALRRLDDFDTWWHLAAGRWIAAHRAIPATDVLSYTAKGHEWINPQWLYDLLLYAVWQMGGASALVLLAAASYVTAFGLIAKSLARSVGPIANALLLLWVATWINERLLIRPEMASFPLLAAVQLVLASGRESPRRLRGLVPLMLVWANLHSLFVLGVAAIGCAIAGAVAAELPLLPPGWRRDSAWPAPARRALLVWGGAAVAVTLVTPFTWRGLLYPFQLMAMIDGSSPIYQSIGEFRSPFAGSFQTFAIRSYQAFLVSAAALAAIAGGLRAFARPRARGESDTRARFDVGALAFAAALAWQSLLARRNLGVFGVGAAPFVGACTGIVLARLPRTWTAPERWPARIVGASVLAACAAVFSLVVTNRWYAMTGETHESGLGVLEANFQPRATAFFREQKLPGPLYNDLTAGGYLTFDDPSGQGVYVDGRLQVFDAEFFGAYLRNLGDVAAWQQDADARGIESVMLFHRWPNRHAFLHGLIASQAWSLVYYDETAVILVRAEAHGDAIASARRAFEATWRPRTDAALSAPLASFSWQWPIGRTTGQLSYARLLETLGEPAAAFAWFEAAIATGLPPDVDVDTRQQVARYLAAWGRLAEARQQLEQAAASDPENEITRGLLAELDAYERRRR